jgi:hypothetical protein
MLEGAKFIRELYEQDEFKPILIQGDHGFGKTSYANRVISEVYSFKNDNHPMWKWGFFEKHLGFSPDEVLGEWIHKRKRDYCYHWDDAGLWLNALDFQDPFVKDVGKYMQVARTDWACILFTSINIDDIASKIRGLRNAIWVDITKDGMSYKDRYRRTAVAYIMRRSFKGRPWKDVQWEDSFSCHVPDEFYKFYKPKREHYTDIAKKTAARRWEEKKLRDVDERIRSIQIHAKVKKFIDKQKSDGEDVESLE